MESGVSTSAARRKPPPFRRICGSSGCLDTSPLCCILDLRSVLVVGCGAGVTAGSFVLYPEVERIVICEIEPLIPEEVTKFFKQANYDVVHDWRVEIVYDDARHFILTTQEKFDVITSDPIHPWVKGAAALYTKEYFELCKRHLNPDGLVTQWVPLYESDDATVKSEIATFFDAFPNGTLGATMSTDWAMTLSLWAGQCRRQFRSVRSKSDWRVRAMSKWPVRWRKWDLLM